MGISVKKCFFCVRDWGRGEVKTERLGAILDNRPEKVGKHWSDVQCHILGHFGDEPSSYTRGAKLKARLTLGECREQNAVMISLFFLSEANEDGVLDVASHVGQRLNACVHFALKEPEQRVTDVLHRTLHRRQRLRTTNNNN